MSEFRKFACPRQFAEDSAQSDEAPDAGGGGQRRDLCLPCGIYGGLVVMDAIAIAERDKSFVSIRGSGCFAVRAEPAIKHMVCPPKQPLPKYTMQS
jgi:hypothetical protein